MVDDEFVNTPPTAQDERRLILDQPFDADLLYALRATLEAHATHAGMPDGRAMDLVITVHELATNAVVHGAGTGRVRIWRAGDTLRCEVSDAGPATRPAATPDADAAPDAVPDAARWPVEHGHGLWIARFLPDRFTIGSGPEGTVAVADFALPPDGHDEPFGLDRHDRGSHTVLELSGALGDVAAQELAVVVREIVSAGPEPRLLLDLGKVTFWDAMGVAALITAQQQVNGAKAGAMVLTGLTADFRRRLDALSPAPLTVGDTRDEAVRRLLPRS
ncbi:ATP-binding protein [Nonomuraea sp. SMC257]|uniref:ATP-binding protein n=1 Tax=Nonomuraea montanisoli TaxID=2741721 RepID=A0A7Y6IJ13_9ACTN|nr:ATP-binding protein [Nonomuraea montanisoli]NUW37764.1 ATP-binding protein [Nonomuraea montanisoli]